MSSSSIESVLTENRSFPPPEAFAQAARVGSLADYQALYDRAARDPDGFWAEVAGELEWVTRWQQVLDWKLPDARWFVGGALNASVSCVDRHARSWRKNKAALLSGGGARRHARPHVRAAPPRGLQDGERADRARRARGRLRRD